MLYKEFTETYKQLLKSFPDVSTLYESKDAINLTTKHFKKIGRRWQLMDEKTEAVDYEHYCNVVDPKAVKFFRSLGGVEQVTKSYTRRGYIPTEVSSTSPDRTTKTVRTFTF